MSDTWTETITLAVAGMTCGSCERHVESALRSVPGVLTVDVSRADGLATVVHRADQIAEADLVAAVGQAGYRAEVQDRAPSAGLPVAAAKASCSCCAR